MPGWMYRDWSAGDRIVPLAAKNEKKIVEFQKLLGGGGAFSLTTPPPPPLMAATDKSIIHIQKQA